MKNKKWLMVSAILLIAVLALSGCSGKEGGSKGSKKLKETPATDFSYLLNNDKGGIVITKYTGEGGDVVIPTQIEGYPVIRLGDRAFRALDTNGLYITSIVIPASVKEIGSDCFREAERLRSVTILGSGVTVYRTAFRDLGALTELIFPDVENALIPADDDPNAGTLYSKGAFYRSIQKLPLATREKLKSFGFDTF